jgi:hypothetical protein
LESTGADGGADQELPGKEVLAELQEQNVSWKEAKQMAKKQSPLAEICDGPVFHLGTAGDDDDDDEYLMKCEAKSFLNNFLYLQPH